MKDQNKNQASRRPAHLPMRFSFAIMVFVFAATHGSLARADGGAFVGAERGNRVSVVDVGFTMPGRRDLAHGDAWRVDQNWKARIAYWRADHKDASARHLGELGLVPTIRIAGTSNATFNPFAEAGIGFHLLSRTKIDDRLLGTAFQFGEHLALGITFGPHREYALALRAEHISNGRIKPPNNGMTFAGIELQYAWR